MEIPRKSTKHIQRTTRMTTEHGPMVSAPAFRRRRQPSCLKRCHYITLLLILCHFRVAYPFAPQGTRLNHPRRLIRGALSATPHSGRQVPQHIAFICDGNSRWAEARHLPAAVGHAVGAEKLLNCIETLKKAGVECCTMYAFSTENWKRTDKEIRDILAVIEQTAKSFQYRAIEENVRVKILGDMEDPRLPTTVRDALMKLQRDTHAAFDKRKAGEEQLTVCLAVNYGGRQDIVNASLKLAKAIAEGRIDASDVTEESFGQLLFTSDIPSPDLVVRTGGDQRLSNFLLWDVAYAELYFSDILWPDFDGLELNKALTWFTSRSRRFGGRQSSSKTSLQESHKP